MNSDNSRSSTPTDALANAANRANLPESVLAATRAWLTEQLVAEEFAKLGQGGHTQNQVPLRRVFVDLPVTETAATNRLPSAAAHTNFLEAFMRSPPLELHVACSPVAPSGSLTPDEPDDVQLQHQRARRRARNFGAILLIGGPGQGKSTLGQLACQLHRAALLKPFESNLTHNHRELLRTFESGAPKRGPRATSPLGLPKSPLLPLQISLPELAAWLAREHPSSSDFPAILKFVTSLASAKKSKLTPEALTALVVQIPSLIVLDGFDEVGATLDRERLIAAIHELLSLLIDRRASAQIIATTRPQGYAGELGRIGIRLRECHLAPLSPDEALGYAEKLVEAKIQGVDLQQKTLDRLREAAAEPATERLLSTPLQVTILTALVQQGRAPRERWKLFWSYFDYTYKREIERETYASRLLADHRSHIEAIHARVALLLQVEAERAGGAAARMPRARLRLVVDTILSEDEIEENLRGDLVDDIVKAAEQRLVFLVEPEPGSFGFEIRSLQEFMAAWALTSGREADVEGRLLQVVKAPMFRNVTLFVASRLFSEASPLRDALADKIYGSLDEDPSDDLSRATRAGALLALETLEEGAVLSQPKRARALMERAIGLLNLPTGAEHARLARAANRDTASTLRTAIEQRIPKGKGDEQSASAAWVCLLEAIELGEQWAEEVASLFWPWMKDWPDHWWACARARVNLGGWFARKVESEPDTFRPEDFVPYVHATPSNTWTAWLSFVYQNVTRHRHGVGNPYGIALVREHAQADAETIEPAELPPPEPWRAWVATARYELSPSAERLAAAISVVADCLPIDRWPRVAMLSSWPLAACLSAAGSVADLVQFSAMLRTGELGDANNWREAQQKWGSHDTTLFTREQLNTTAPWSKDSLPHSPPFLLLHAFRFPFRYSRRAPDPIGIVKAASELLETASSQSARRRLAEICLAMTRHVATETTISEEMLHPWLSIAPEGAGYLFPRPKAIEEAVWLRAMAQAPPARLRNLVSPGRAVEAFVESGGSVHVLRLVLESIRFRFSSVSDEPGLLAALRTRVIPLLDGLPSDVPFVKAATTIIRVLIGVLDRTDEQLIRDVRAAAVAEQWLWDALIGAIHADSLPWSRASSLLAAAHAEAGAGNPAAREFVEQARRLLESKRSDLDNHTIWDRLALPLPQPEMEPTRQVDGRMPATPVAIVSVELRDVRGIHHLQLSPSPPNDNNGQWVVVLGPNGIGKTTLLRSLALALRNVRDPAIWPKGAFAERWPRLAGGGASEARIVLRLTDQIVRETFVRSNGSTTVTQSPEQTGPRLFPLFAYGCRRGSALGGAAREVVLGDDDGPEIATLFDEGASLIHAETWLLQWEGDAAKNERSRAIFETVLNAVKLLLDLTSIDVTERRIWITERSGTRIPFSALSDGHLTTAGWLLDLVARWIALAERVREPIDGDFMRRMKGLVLIDELDLHLHPRFQINVVSRVRQLFPQLSFVVTTHNPLTLVGARADEIWILSASEGRLTAVRGAEAPMLLTGGQIYRRYFGIDDIFPDGLGRKLQRYGFLSGYSLRNDDEESELATLQSELQEAGVAPGWEVTPQLDHDALRAPVDGSDRKPSRRKTKGSP